MKKAHLYLIEWGLEKGYLVKIYSEGEFKYSGTSYLLAKEACEAKDMGFIYLVTGQSETDDDWFAYVHEDNQEPDEIIYDYIVNEISDAWEKDYSKHCA